MSEVVTCRVCGELEQDAKLLATCDSCSNDFHLNPYQTPGKDCGEVTIDDMEEPTLQFYCRACIVAASV